MKWRIIDNNGTIYSGTQEEMENTFSSIIDGSERCDWEGDLLLIEVHQITK